MDLLRIFITGVVTIGLITAFGLHAKDLANLTKSAGSAGQGLLSTAESGK